ncbi:hypothetical protein ASE67_17020 [Sphingomonas sp. Leaf23]|uniref:SMI1/KNR4 family protein n=1 Tax=Sphingomonas sp. Leaf23 TaxID=1735689 RepID=UPI0006F51E08|nr:SMI1/KNR4 family protein [Sphingomonas sp. Leaf23]KQM81648.1 hypothetical protein ASE67_17020 [Sphingomonas sp. Leaf23]
MLLWRAYVADDVPPPDDRDRARIEAAIGGRLPDAYWALVVAHQGKVPEGGEGDPPPIGVLLLANAPDRVGDGDRSYCIEECWRAMRDYYPAGLLPFSDDTGGDVWAFDFRLDPERPAVVFIDHEIEGEAGITPVAPDFAGYWALVTGTA